MNLNFKQITIEDRYIFETFFKSFPPLISEFTFTNLFIWNNSRRIRFAKYESSLLIIAETSSETYFLPPIGQFNANEIAKVMFDYADKTNMLPEIRRADDRFSSELDRDLFSIDETPDHSDYIYNSSDLANLPGRAFKNKRAFVRKFTSNYYHRYSVYDKSYKNKCLDLAEKRINSIENEGAEDYNPRNEFDALETFLNYYEYLLVNASVLLADNQVCAFTAGEPLNNETFVIHFEKADTTMEGSYQTINKVFIENEIHENYKLVNREQDLGIPGIRKAKRSYNPTHLINKYTIKTK